MSHTIYFPTIMGGAGNTDTGDDADQQIRPQPHIPTGLNLGMPWQWQGDVHAMRVMLGYPGWYDWHWASGGESYQRMIYSRIPDREWPIIRQLIRRDPSHLWLVLNEPERVDQANLEPEEGAAVARQMIEAGACIAVPGVIVTHEGLTWLEWYLDAGGPVPDAWHVHLYFCYTPDGIDDRLDMWGEWMERRDVNRPTIISEFNAQDRDVGQQIAMMQHMALRLGQAAAAREQGRDDWLWAAYWFSLNYKANASDTGVTNVIDEDGAVNELGRAFVEERMDGIENLA